MSRDGCQPPAASAARAIACPSHPFPPMIPSPKSCCIVALLPFVVDRRRSYSIVWPHGAQRGSAMNRFTQFALWSALLVSGAWSALVVVGLAVITALFYTAATLHMPVAPGLDYTAGYRMGQASAVVALLTAVVGVPIVARRYRVGFWRGSLAVLAALCWLVLPFWLLVAWRGPAFAVLVAAGLDFLIAVVLAVILYRRRRARRRGPPNIADVFS